MTDNDFKYMMQDLYRLYFGVKCTYREILENEDAYYKFKAVCRQYLVKEVDPETTLESHLYHLTPDQPAAEVYRQIQKVFAEEIWNIDELMALSAHSKQFRGIVLSELQIPKIKLREFAV